jgi:hypothetical protein
MASKSNGFVLTKTMQYVERLAELKEQLEELQAQHDRLQTRLRKRLGRTDGVHHAITVWDAEGKAFDHDRARRRLGVADYERCWKPTAYRNSRLIKIR